MISTNTLSISALLTEERICVRLDSAEKEAAIDEIVDTLDGASEVIDLDQLRADVHAREAVMSTGVGNGLALPHTRTSAVLDTLIAFAITEAPIDFDAIDGKPVRLIFLLVGPENERGSHVRLLGRISRLMAIATFREQVSKAESAEEVIQLFEE
ncbi:MAG: PTS sugar transporter subunit IIA, partial [Rubricoccaceae bacterium]|nr:PTS sugar transporter subunit IIA [Rubricoccaceae bacterium]